MKVTTIIMLGIILCLFRVHFSHAQERVKIETVDPHSPSHNEAAMMAPSGPGPAHKTKSSPLIEKKVDKNWIIYKDTNFISNYYIDPIYLIEPISFLIIPSNLRIKEIKEMEYRIDPETKDTIWERNPNTDLRSIYDELGRFKELYFLTEEVGKVKSIKTTDYTYLKNNLIEKVHYYMDGSISAIQTYKYHDNGSILSSDYIQIDNNNNEKLIDRKLYEYLDNNEVIEYQYEYNEEAKNWVLKNLKKHQFDELGRIIKTEKLNLEFEQIDYSHEYQYLPNNFVILMTESTYFKTEVKFEYNKERRIQSIKTINNGTNTIELIELSYQLDNKGIYTHCTENFKIIDDKNQTIRESQTFYHREIKYK